MPNRDPYIATAIREEISNLSQNEVDSLNRFLDDTIEKIDENNELYDQYATQWIGLREQVSDANDFIADMRIKRIKAKKLKKAGKDAVTVQEVVEKVNTISMSLNPVAAALQFAAKILKTELEHELKGLQDTAAIINPAIDNFTRFSGGVIIATGETVEGDLNRKIRELEERIAKRKALRKARIDKLFERRKGRRDRIKKAKAEVEAHNKSVREEQEKKAKENSEEKATAPTPEQQAASVGQGEGEQVLTETATQGPTITPVTQLVQDTPIETVTTVVESTDTGMPQGLDGQVAISNDLDGIDDDGDGVVTVDDIFDAVSPDENNLSEIEGEFVGPVLPQNEGFVGPQLP